jgi:hypothetical protein
MKMIGNTALRCPWGCCRITGTGRKGRKIEKRAIKHSKRENNWKRELN